MRPAPRALCGAIVGLIALASGAMAASAGASANSGPAQWSSVSAGGSTVCALDNAKQLWCWGDNNFGQVGDGTYDDRPTPVRVGRSTWLSVRTSGPTTCAVRSDRTGWCWGANVWGEVGNGGSAQMYNTPKPVSGGKQWSRIRPGVSHTCGITTRRTLYCWGNDFYRQLGDGPIDTTTSVPIRIGTGTTWTAIAPGANNTCALTLNKVAYCWGTGEANGTGTSGEVAYPTRIPNTWNSLDNAGFSSCGITTQGIARCWGDNTAGKLGTGDTTTRATPTTLAEQSEDFTRVEPGLDHTCALRTADGTIRCFGSNDQHQFGNGSTDGSPIPVGAAANKVRWTSLSVGDDFACGLRNAGKIFCWGDNTFGQLGVGNAGVYDRPVQVGTSPPPISAQSPRRSHMSTADRVLLEKR